MDCCEKYMCEEMVIKILARLPAKSLVRFMAVCRLWKSIIRSSHFRLEFSKQRHTTKLLVHTARECYSLDEKNGRRRLMFETYFPPISSKHYNSSYDIPVVIGSDNGLICIGIRKLQHQALSSRKDYFFRVIIWNPLIRKHVVIPYNPLVDDNIVPHFEYACGFGDFKYVRVVGAYPDGGKGSLRKAVDVYSMKAGTWGRRKYLDWDFTQGLSSSSSLYLNSALLRSRLHWIGGGTRSNQILSFDLEEEAFEDKTIMLPPEASFQYYYSCRRGSFPASVSVIRESQLGVITNEIGLQYSAVWVMQEYGDVDSWNKLFNIDLTVENIYRRIGPTMIHLLEDNGGEILLGLSRMKEELVTYNTATMKTRNDYFGGGGGGLLLPQLCGFTNFYKESLVLLADDDDSHGAAVADHLSMLDQ